MDINIFGELLTDGYGDFNWILYIINLVYKNKQNIIDYSNKKTIKKLNNINLNLFAICPNCNDNNKIFDGLYVVQEILENCKNDSNNFYLSINNMRKYDTEIQNYIGEQKLKFPEFVEQQHEENIKNIRKYITYVVKFVRYMVKKENNKFMEEIDDYQKYIDEMEIVDNTTVTFIDENQTNNNTQTKCGIEDMTKISMYDKKKKVMKI